MATEHLAIIMEKPRESHHLLLKVKRIPRPTLAVQSLLNAERRSPSPLSEAGESDSGDPELQTGPTSFGNVYLGETFGCSIHVTNQSTPFVHDVGIKADIQTNSQRLSLKDTTSETISALEQNKTVEYVVQHEVKELGIHVLSCSVSYVTNSGEKRSFRRVYRFQVMNPLAVKTKVNNMVDGKVFLEVQVQNVADREMYLERMKFESGDVFEFKDLNHVVNDQGEEVKVKVGIQQPQDLGNHERDLLGDESAQKPKEIENFGDQKLEEELESVFGKNTYLNPQDIRQYLYMLTPKPGIDDRLTRTTNALGRLDIIWRSNTGETGRLQTSQLTRKPPVLEEIELSVTTTPLSVILETPFKLGCRVRNRTNSVLEIVVTAVKKKMGAVLLSGPSTKHLGELAPDATVDFLLEFVPLSPGLQKVGGLKLSDLISGYTKEIEHFTEIFVLFDK